jgi:hypothetical protein
MIRLTPKYLVLAVKTIMGFDFEPLTFEAALGLIVGVLCYKIYKSKCHERFHNANLDIELFSSPSFHENNLET